jgi:hypothetical protein
LRWLESLQVSLTADKHDQVAQSLVDLGGFLGFESFRPAGSGVTDTVWKFAFGPKIVITLEVKAELDGRPVAQRDIDQAHGQGRVTVDSYGQEGYVCAALIVANAAVLEPGLLPRLGNVRCLTQSSLASLFHEARALFHVFQSRWDSASGDKRREAREAVANRISPADWLTASASEAQDGFVSVERLLGPWTSR